MKYTILISASVAIASLLAACNTGTTKQAMTDKDTLVKLITLDPGHFHAALVQKTSLPGVDSVVYVYAPDGPEVKSHLDLVNSYNNRAENPTHWKEEVYTGSDYLEKMVAEKKGNVVVMSGNNQRKTEYINRSVAAGMNVLGDKPMAIDTQNFRLLEKSFALAADKKVMLYDIMTERSEITNILQKEFSQLPEIFGTLQAGTTKNPGVVLESVHHFYKFVSGSALKRPSWFFDPAQQGDAIVDVGTHLVDLVQWECFPETVINYATDVEIQGGRKWPAPVTLSEFSEITKMDSFPAYLKKYVVKDSVLNADVNGSVDFSIKGIHARITAVWNYKAPEGAGDTHYCLLRGTKCNLVIRQGKEDNYQPTLYIETIAGSGKSFGTDLQQAMAKITAKYPGVTVANVSGRWKVIIPENYKIGHEAHFGQVMQRYLGYMKSGAMPDWEVPNMLAKYYITTFGSAKASQVK